MDQSLVKALRHWLADEQRREAALLSAGNQGSAYLFDEEVDGRRVRLVVKRAAAGALTGWAHRWMLRREARAYALMADVAGVPHSPGFLDGRWLLLEYIEGDLLTTRRHGLSDPEAFYERLLQILHDFHAAGVSHGDLKRKENVLVTVDEQPFVIDFGTAVTRSGSLWDWLMFRLVRRFDYHAWIKVKYNNDYDAISDADLRWYRPTTLEKVASSLLKFWRVITLRQWRKQRRRAREARRKPGS